MARTMAARRLSEVIFVNDEPIRFRGGEMMGCLTAQAWPAGITDSTPPKLS